jgi:hypothetical protein
MAGLQSLLEDYRNWASTQDWRYKKQLEQMFGGDPQLMEDFERLSGVGPSNLGGISGSITHFPLKGLTPLLEKKLIVGKSRTPNEPIIVDFDKAGNMYIADGNHRYYEAMDKGLSTIAGYYAPKAGRRLTLKEEIRMAPEYNSQLFDVGPRRQK